MSTYRVSSFVDQRFEAAMILTNLLYDFGSNFIKSWDFKGMYDSAGHVTASENSTAVLLDLILTACY